MKTTIVKIRNLAFMLIGSWVLVSGLTSCEKDLPVYDTEVCRLNFYYGLDNRSYYKDEMSRSTYSFVFGGENRQRDTLWFEVQTMGFVTDNDRPVTLEQLPSDGDQAVAGRHYVPFDDPSLVHLYVIPAGKARTKLPVVILRDASLKEQTVTLKFGFKSNEYFVLGYEEYSTRQVEFTDRLSEPSMWNKQIPYPDFPDYTYCFADYFGEYGVVKHQFLIDETGKKWDDEYITSLLEGDSNYLTYMVRKMSKRLDEVNAERLAQGLDVLREADGTPVEIEDPYAY